MKPISRARFDKAVMAMIRSADTNHDGVVTIDEVRAIIEARRDAVIQARFARIDRNHNGSIDLEEFVAWQRTMGSLSLAESRSLGDTGGPVPEVIEPELGDGIEDRLLARLIEPLSAITIVNANVNYHAGASLDELLAYEHKRFDAADTDKDGEISMEEVRGIMRPSGSPDGGPGGPPPDFRPPR